LKKGEDYYKIRWAGLDERGDTTEPAEHLRDEASKAKIQEFLDAREAAEPPPRAVRMAEVRSGESVAEDGCSTEDTIVLQDGSSAARRVGIKHAKTSPVWRFCSAKFLGKDGRAATICSLCQEQLAAPNTTNIWNHLVRHHSSILVEDAVSGHKVRSAAPHAGCRPFAACVLACSYRSSFDTSQRLF